MSIGITLTKKEQIKLSEHLREIEKGRTEELSKAEISVLTYKFKTEVLVPARKETSERRARRRESLKESHASVLQWQHTRPPRHSLVR
ncbi:TPA: hypothetical protein JG832_002442 [Enterobacter hormaechei subsp. xiangfangensis]|nr:hypothetical protein [Enterobacter hormaechei subsp. xiangfangensis]HAV1890578.1 hypothetical protein [Enterobacter hormaechei subsp. xiangfangensis]